MVPGDVLKSLFSFSDVLVVLENIFNAFSVFPGTFSIRFEYAFPAEKLGVGGLSVSGSMLTSVIVRGSHADTRTWSYVSGCFVAVFLSAAAPFSC